MKLFSVGNVIHKNLTWFPVVLNIAPLLFISVAINPCGRLSIIFPRPVIPFL